MVYQVLDDEKKNQGVKGMRNPSEKGEVGKKGYDENTTPSGKLSIRKKDGLSKNFGEDKPSRK